MSGGGLPELPPMGWTQFTLAKPDRSLLEAVNLVVNDRIIPTPADASKLWRIIEGDDPALDGCCHDYAVTKRAMLLGRGWAPDALSLRVVSLTPEQRAKYGVGNNDYHMVLVALWQGQELVLDNLRPDIVTWPQAGYQAISSQQMADPNLWLS